MFRSNAVLAKNFEASVVKRGEASLRVFSAGSGDAIVFLPGIGRGPSDFCSMAEKFQREGFMTILPEGRGFGESVGPLEGLTIKDMALDIVEQIKAKTSGPVVILGAYFGGRIARMVATLEPKLIRGTVILTAVGKAHPSEAALREMDGYFNSSLSPEVRYQHAKRAGLFGPGFNRPWEELEVDNISPANFAAQKKSLAFGSYTDYWSGGSAPMLVFQGLADLLSDKENGRSLKRDYPDRVRIKDLEGVGHALLLEAPDLIFKETLAWIRSGFKPA